MKGARLVSDFLKDLGLPLVERRHVYLLVDVDDTPLWVIGLRADDRTRVTHSCSSVLKVSCHLI
jgi:tRNA(Ile)-lysidine synthase